MANIFGTTVSDVLDGGASADVISGGEGGDVLNGGGGDDVIYGFGVSDVSGGAMIHATRVASGFSRPVFAVSPPGEPDRLFIIEQHTGQIKILDLGSGAVLPTPFLDVPANELSTASEQGLLGLAFDPNYATNGVYYVNLTNAAGATEVWRYARGADLDFSSTARELIITYSGTAATNHNGGWIGFGPDGMLFIAQGDGGSGNDPLNNAQNINSLFGKILRLDVSGDDFPGDATRNYAIPDDNPYVGVDGADEVYAIGLRNPWRISFDSSTGDMIIADVGQAAREEINFIPAGTLSGRNFGWVVMEGTTVHDTTRPGNPPANSPIFTVPIYDYTRGEGPYQGFAVTGGYLLRGPDAGGQGLYIFGDYVSGNIWTLRAGAGSAEDIIQRNGQFVVDVGDVDTPSSFAVDGQGRIYVIGLDGEIHRLTFNDGAGDARDAINGGDGNDRMYGGVGDDTLRGEAGDDRMVGGIGADLLLGGAGDDTYYIDDAGDVVSESANAGFDTVRSPFSRSLTPNFERLVLTGAEAVNGSGNALNNILIGNDAANKLNGAAGADTMQGGGGNDIYVVDNAGDVTIEALGAGHDIVRSSVSRALDANIEGLTLTGAASISGSGNALNNVIRGNAGDNVLNGVLGNDLLTGGAGADIFVFSTTAGVSNRDRITDFNVADDTIHLSSGVYTALAPGALAAGALNFGTAASEADDRLIYNSSTGILLYDPDGSSVGGVFQVAFLPAGLSLATTDFFVT